MIAEIITEGNSPKIVDRHHRRNSPKIVDRHHRGE